MVWTTFSKFCKLRLTSFKYFVIFSTSPNGPSSMLTFCFTSSSVFVILLTWPRYPSNTFTFTSAFCNNLSSLATCLAILSTGKALEKSPERKPSLSCFRSSKLSRLTSARKKWLFILLFFIFTYAKNKVLSNGIYYDSSLKFW